MHGRHRSVVARQCFLLRYSWLALHWSLVLKLSVHIYVEINATKTSSDPAMSAENGDPKKNNEAVPTWLVAARAELLHKEDASDGGGSSRDDDGDANNEENGRSSGNNIPMNNNMTTIRQQFGSTLSTASNIVNANVEGVGTCRNRSI